jgi:hypothetical protein
MNLYQKEQNHLRPLFRIITGVLCLLGIYEIYLIILVQYNFIIDSTFDSTFFVTDLFSLLFFYYLGTLIKLCNF